MIAYELPIVQRQAEKAWDDGTRPWLRCLAQAFTCVTIPKGDLFDPNMPAYMRSGMTDLERAVTLRNTVVFGATVEVKGENLEDAP